MCRYWFALLASLTTTLAIQAAPIITVYPSIGPNLFVSPNGEQYILNSVQGLLNNTSTAGTPGTPSFYSRSGPNVPINSMIATGFPSWLGVLNPASPYNNEGGNRLHFGLSAISPRGSNEIRLADLEAEIVSTDSNGFLSVTREFVGGNYGFDLIGVRRNPDGSINTIFNNGESGALGVDELYFFGYGQAFEISEGDFPDPNNRTQSQFAALISNPNVTSATPFTIRGNYYLGNVSGGTTVTVGPSQFVPLPASVWIFASAVSLLAIRRRLAQKA